MDGRPNTASATTRSRTKSSTLPEEEFANDNNNNSRRRRKRPSTAAALENQKKKVADNVREIEQQLGELQRVGAYDKAGKLYTELKKLKSSFKNDESQK